LSVSTPAAEIAVQLRDHGLTLGTVESATGGLISHLLTNIPGSSHFFRGSIVAYSNEIKSRIVGVTPEMLERYGAVSAEVAREMAAGGRRLLSVDICLADTGIAGPEGGSTPKPVGLFYLGLSCAGGTYGRRHLFTGDRTTNKQSAADAALEWLGDFLAGRWSAGLS
jgi:nicotinamide-nucleotide amidase